MSKTSTDEQWKLLVTFLKEISLAKGITQQEISDRTGLLRPNINRVFSLRYTPTIDTFLRIARAIGVNFYIENTDGTSELNLLFEKAMDQLGRRPDNLSKN